MQTDEMNWDFKTRNVMVTAGASGIGRSIAVSFHRARARVHVVDIDPAASTRMQKDFPDIMTSIADVSDERSVNACFDRQHRQGALDVLVNCAGIAGPTARVEEVDLSDWRRCITVNLDATFLCTRKAIPLMKQIGRGRIINISSTAGWHGYPLRSPYSSAKWAVIGFTKSVAMELGTSGITANVICPGSVKGERMDRVIAMEAKKRRVSEQAVRESYTRSCSMRTFISGQDIADMALFLASEAASRVTGQVMNVDGHLESFAG